MLLLTSLVFVISGPKFDLWTIRRNFEQVKYQAEIEKYSKKFKIEEELLAALIYVESRFNNSSESNKGAVGLMQIMPSTALWIADELGHHDFELKDLTKPEINIKFGSWYFAYLYQKFDGNLIKTIAAYNAGENNVRNWIDAGWDGDLELKLPFKETDNFVRRVISTKNYYQKNNLNIFSFSNFNILLAKTAQ